MGKQMVYTFQVTSDEPIEVGKMTEALAKVPGVKTASCTNFKVSRKS